MLHTITNVPWFIPNSDIREYLKLDSIKNVASEYS